MKNTNPAKTQGHKTKKLELTTETLRALHVRSGMRIGEWAQETRGCPPPP